MGDLMFDLPGYVFCLLSVAAQSAYLLLVEIQGNGMGGHGNHHTPVSSQELLYYNSITSLPLLLVLVWADGSLGVLSEMYTTVRGVTCHAKITDRTAQLLRTQKRFLHHHSILLCYSLFCAGDPDTRSTHAVGGCAIVQLHGHAAQLRAVLVYHDKHCAHDHGGGRAEGRRRHRTGFLLARGGAVFVFECDRHHVKYCRRDMVRPNQVVHVAKIRGGCCLVCTSISSISFIDAIATFIQWKHNVWIPNGFAVYQACWQLSCKCVK